MNELYFKCMKISKFMLEIFYVNYLYINLKYSIISCYIFLIL